jgi:hypothetical protein
METFVLGLKIVASILAIVFYTIALWCRGRK